MAVLEPLSEVLRWHWRPDFTFGDRRSVFLGQLDQKDLLHAWRLQDDLVGALIEGEVVTEALIEPDLATFSAAGPTLPDQLWTAVELAGHVFGPVTEGLELSHQHVIPLDLDYDGARTLLGDRLWSAFAAVGATDFALLVDGAGPGGTWKYQMEFGVVEGRELADRLARRVGRSPIAHSRATLSGASIDPPAVSFFLDITWALGLDEGGPDLSSVRPSPDLTGQVADEERQVVGTVLESLRVSEHLMGEDERA